MRRQLDHQLGLRISADFAEAEHHRLTLVRRREERC
jgi:hypothetical protein